MTREEIIDYLNILKIYFLGSEHQPISDAYFALDDAIKLLEQEPVLDKIRAEIGMYYADCTSMSQGDCEECTENVFQSIFRIIDKYKEESEG